MSRYVILRHEMPPESSRASHWDLMLEFAGSLRTWAVDELSQSGLATKAQALEDHRLEYLEYEGPISGGRGTVTRWDQGDYHVQRQSERELIVILHGKKLRGVARLQQEGDRHCWLLSISSD